MYSSCKSPYRYREKYKCCAQVDGFWNEKWVETEATPDLLLMSSTIFSSFSTYFPQYFLHPEHIFHNIFSYPEQLNRTHCPLLAWSDQTNNQSLQNTTEWPQRLVTFETFDQSDEKTCLRHLRHLRIRDIWDDFVTVLLLLTFKERPLRPDNDNDIWDIWDIWDIC